MTIRPGLLALTLLLTLSGQAQAYSYAAAGKEPLIDAREALLGAATDGKDASATLSEIAEELTYLEEHHQVELQAPLAAAIKAKDAAATAALLNRAYKAEIERRLEGASQNLGDYQTAKVLVVKSKRFLDLILPPSMKGIARPPNRRWPRCSMPSATRECSGWVPNLPMPLPLAMPKSADDRAGAALMTSHR